MSDVPVAASRHEPRWKMPRLGWAVFVTSLALNLLVLGSFIGLRWAGHHHGWHGGGMRSVLRELPRDQREEVRGILNRHRDEIRPLRRELRERRRAFVTYAESDTVDRAELERHLDSIDEQRQAIRNRLRPMILELSEKLDPQARARVLRRLVRGRGRHGRRWRHRYRD